MVEEKCFQCFSEAGQRITVRYGSWTRAGADPYGRAKQNQDSHVIEEYIGGDTACFFGVFDGHGAEGAKISQHLKHNLPRDLSEAIQWRTHDSREVFEQQMPLCNDKLIANPNIKTQLSGSTAITALLQNNALLTVANVGDSRCLLGRADGEEVEALAMNTDHTPNVPDEAARITSCKGRIQPYLFDGQFVGPKRIWLRHRDSPGLSMTRAFGDEIGATIGIISDPEINQVVLRPEHKYLILCSDGIYEFMDNQYIMSIVHHQALNGWTPTDVAKALVAEANRQWMEEEDGIIDDCTVIVAFLDVSAPPASTVKNGSKSKKFAGTEGSVSKAFSHVAKKASFLLTPQEMIQKVNIGGSRK